MLMVAGNPTPRMNELYGDDEAKLSEIAADVAETWSYESSETTSAWTPIRASLCSFARYERQLPGAACRSCAVTVPGCWDPRRPGCIARR
jgi:hypothetical protein